MHKKYWCKELAIGKAFAFAISLTSLVALFLLDSGNMQAFGLSNGFTPNIVQPSAISKSYITTDKSYYQVGPQQQIIVKIYGNIQNLENGIVKITITTPHGDYKYIDTYTNASGSFSVPYLIGLKSFGGSYEVKAIYNGGQINTSFIVSKSFVWEA